jgi:hypothetical protein|tara:strand:+ start:2185 stop:2679 length:495 start_codon:yes stop_codon:yes gene_type:complete
MTKKKTKYVTRDMLTKLCKRLFARCKLLDKIGLSWQHKAEELEKDLDKYDELGCNMSKRFMDVYKNNLELWKLNQELGEQNQQFLKERNDVIRKYNFLVQAKKEVEAAELAGWNRKLPENKHYKFEEFKADVLESGKVRYVVKMKRHTLPSGKKIKLATKEDKK